MVADHTRRRVILRDGKVEKDQLSAGTGWMGSKLHPSASTIWIPLYMQRVKNEASTPCFLDSAALYLYHLRLLCLKRKAE
jgi:hypothetical protein